MTISEDRSNTQNIISEANKSLLDIKKESEIEFIDIAKYAFIETPFSERFQLIINNARVKKCWIAIGAYSRNGKSWCIKDLIKNSGAYKEIGGKTWMPIIAIRSPESSNANDLVNSLCRSFGVLPRTTIANQKKWLIDNIPALGVEQIIIDDAHELNINHFKFIKWLTDTLELEKNYYISIVLSSIVSSNTVSVWQKIQQYKGLDWMQQFYERFTSTRQIEGHSPEEVAQILYGLEEVYRHYLPKINIVQYAGNIFAWLTNPQLDIHQCRSVAIGHLSKLIHESARIAYIEHNLDHIPADLLVHVYELYLLNKDKIYSTDNEPIYRPRATKSPEKKIM